MTAPPLSRPAMGSIDRLRLRGALLAGELSLEDRLALVAVLDNITDATTVTPDPRAQILQRRQFFPEVTANAAAEAIAAGLSRYAAGPWTRERTAAALPVHRAGRLEGCFWELLKHRDRPLSARHARRKLPICNGQLSGRRFDSPARFGMPRWQELWPRRCFIPWPPGHFPKELGRGRC